MPHPTTLQFCEQHQIKPKDLFSYSPNKDRIELTRKLVKILRKQGWSFERIGKEIKRSKVQAFRLSK